MSFKKVRDELVQQRGEDQFDLRPCTFCHAPTPHGTLVMYGARCARCYRDYCAVGSKGTLVHPIFTGVKQ